MKSEQMARVLLRLYPTAWRERYGEELLALISESGLTLRIVFDVVLAATVERLRAAAALIRGEQDALAEPPPSLLTLRYMYADIVPCTTILCATIVLLRAAGIPYPPWSIWLMLLLQGDGTHNWPAPRLKSRAARLFVWCYWFGLAVGLAILGWSLAVGLRAFGVPETSTSVNYWSLGLVLGAGLVRAIYVRYRWMAYNSTWPGLHPLEIRAWQGVWFSVLVITAMADPGTEALWPWAMILWMSLRPPYGLTREGIVRMRALKEARDRESPWGRAG